MYQISLLVNSQKRYGDGYYQKLKKEMQSSIKKLNSVITDSLTIPVAEKTSTVEAEAGLLWRNPDYIGWIHIEGSYIDYLVLQGE